MIKQLVIQLEDGGLIPTSPLHLVPLACLDRHRIIICRYKKIRWIFEKFHYKGGHIGGGISFCIALVDGLEIVGGAVIGKPRPDKYSDNGEKVILEIRRMALLDSCPKNSESYFLSKIIWYIKKATNADAVLSYSDLSVGHIGTIYKAANFKQVGFTAPSKHDYWDGVRYHPRSLTINRPYSYQLREAVKVGTAIVKTEQPKAIYIYDIHR